jgi:endonuclease/exonuclease/phosphatase family metal-dependent hydrolase
MSYGMDPAAWADSAEPGAAPSATAWRSAQQVIRDAAPDLLALQGVGARPALEEFADALASDGLVYPHRAWMDHAGGSGGRLALLSRFPLESVLTVTNLSYSIAGRTVPVLRGVLAAEVAIPDGPLLRAVNIQLKSKTFHSLGQTEMRRNEARLVAQLLAVLEEERPGLPLLLCGALNDDYSSAPVREIRNAADLADLRPADALGAAWTAFDSDEDAYRRFDYLLANAPLRANHVPGKSGIPPPVGSAARRPLLAVFRKRDAGDARFPGTGGREDRERSAPVNP